MENNITPVFDIPYIAALASLGKKPDDWTKDHKGFTAAIYDKDFILPSLEDIKITCQLNGELKEIPFSLFQYNLSYYKNKIVTNSRGKRPERQIAKKNKL